MSYKRPDKSRYKFTKKEQAQHSKQWWKRRFDMAETPKDKAFCRKNMTHYDDEIKKLE